jgi:hypothetical protein
MTDMQFYLAVGLPVLAIFVGMRVNVTQFSALNARMTSIETRLDGRIDRLESKFDLLIGKVIELDNRLTRMEERLKH